MKKVLIGSFLLLFTLCMAHSVSAQTTNSQAVTDLLNRIGGDNAADRFVTILDESIATNGKEMFIISKQDEKPCIKGSTISALTTGINWYLNHYAHINIAWNNLSADLVNATLPLPSNDEVHESTADYRYYLNYCTFSYSMAFWTWERWQQEIDWMALHGINMPLQLVGLETLWKNVLSDERLGYTEAEIAEFVAGPGFMAWFAMNNLEGWGGTISATDVTMSGNPDWWYTRQGELCGKMLARMRELGMQPVLPGYCGMVPNSMKNKSISKITTSDIISTGSWGDVYNRPDIVKPRSDSFNYIAEIYYEHLEKLMGVSEFYSMDPFHEGGVVGVTIEDCYNGVMEAMDTYYATVSDEKRTEYNTPENAKWVIQYWQNLPVSSAFTTMDDKYSDRFIALDLFAENIYSSEAAKWKTDYFGSCDFIYCMLHNFGGRSGMHGRMKEVISGYYGALEKTNMRGVGATPEGIETNPVLYDLLFELPWMNAEPTAETWLNDYSYARYGIENEAVKSALQNLRKSVWNCETGQQGTSEAVVLARPDWSINKVSSWSSSVIYWDVHDVRLAADQLLSIKDLELTSDGKANYSYDVLDVVRQSMVDFAAELLPQIKTAYDAGDTNEYKRLYKIFLSLIEGLDAMLANDENFTLERWTSMARNVTDEVEGTTTNDKNWMEWNARTQITVWSNGNTQLHDYSNRCWSGLLKDFHYERWKYFFENNGANYPGGWYAGFEKPWTVNFTDYDYSKTPTTSDNVINEAYNTYYDYFGFISDSDGDKYIFPMGVTSNITKSNVVPQCYRGQMYTLPFTTKSTVTISSLWVDLNLDGAETDDEIITCDGFNITLPETAKIGAADAIATFSDGTQIKFDIAIREEITEARTVSVVSAGNGTVAIEGVTETSVTNTDAVTMLATANSGYNFYRWLDADGNVVSNDNPYTYYAKEAATFTAEFIVDKWGVISGVTSSYADIAGYSQYVDKFTFKLYNREEETIYEADAVPVNIHTTVPRILNVARGSSFDITWSDPTDGLQYTYMHAYIDLNADGDFEDSGELLKTVGTVGATNTAVCGGTINVLLPYDTPTGITHMRVRFDGAWDSPASKGAKDACIRPVYELVLNVTDYPETASTVSVKSNNEDFGTVYVYSNQTPSVNKNAEIQVSGDIKAILVAEKTEGAEFQGWYDRYGRLVTDELVYEMYAPEDAEYTAVFIRTLIIGNWELEFTVEGTEIILTKVVSGSGDLEIPETVTIGDKTYTIVGFENDLFNNNKNLTSITLPKTMRFLSNNTVQTLSLSGSSSAQTVTLDSTLPANEKWSLAMSVERSAELTGWGACLLASGANPTADSYNGGFQLYLQGTEMGAERDKLIAKAGTVSADSYYFDDLYYETSFNVFIDYNGSNTITINALKADGTSAGSELVFSGITVNDITTLCTNITDAIAITKLEIGIGEKPCAFSGCSNLDAINVAEGGSVYSSIDGCLYNADGSELLCTPEGKEKGPDRRRLGALIENINKLIGAVADVDATGKVAGLALQTTNSSGDYYVTTNAQEVKEGPIANLVDGDNSTFFHTNWSSATPPADGLDHHITVNLGDNALSAFYFEYQARSGSGLGDYPKKILVQGSTDGSEYTTISTIEHADNSVPQNGAKYSSSVISGGTTYSYLRFMVTATTTNKNKDGHVFWHMAEFDLYKISASADVYAKYEGVITDGDAETAYDQMVEAQLVYNNGTTAAEMQDAYNLLKEKYDALLSAANSLYPFKLTVDATVPNLYNIIINREGTKALQYDAESAMVAVADYSSTADIQAWYFVPVADGVNIYPYTAEGKILATNAYSEGNSKVEAVEAGTEGYGSSWNVIRYSATQWFNITIVNGTDTYYFSNHGGVSNKMGFYNNAADGGSQFNFRVYNMSDDYYTLLDYYNTVPTSVTGADAPGYYAVQSAEAYNSAYSIAKEYVEAANGLDDYATAYTELKSANEALARIPSEELEDGGVYRIMNVITNTETGYEYHYIANNNASISFPTTATDNSTLWVCRADGDGYKFVSALGTLALAWKTGGEVAHKFVVSDGTTSTFKSLGNGSNVNLALTNEKHNFGLAFNHASNNGTTQADNWSTDWVFDKVDTEVSYNLAMAQGYSWASLYLPYSVEVPEGVTACTSNGRDGEYVLLNPIEDVIPAYTAVLLNRESATDEATYKFVYTATSSSASDVSANALKGRITQGTVACAADSCYYMLLTADDGEALYRVHKEYGSDGSITDADTDDGGYILCKANRAYLPMLATGAENIIAFGLRFDGTTGIEEPEGLGGEVDAIYDLSGRKLESITEPGIYIVNGKKQIIK
ncbi:MAG: alpha-N-acetylglucosaminidase C-terminal domain-containing protein [Bacteroidaceae bacterium]|nr:alpha-N-acetylglucosaminidase C-terminal domain-containing protein [Bacteroidaceae bacterium]